MLVHPHQVAETAKLITVELWQQVVPIDDREAESSPRAIYAMDLTGTWKPELDQLFGGSRKVSVLVAGGWTRELHFEATHVLKLNEPFHHSYLKSVESPLVIIALAAVVERDVTPPPSWTAPKPYESPDPGF